MSAPLIPLERLFVVADEVARQAFRAENADPAELARLALHLDLVADHTRLAASIARAEGFVARLGRQGDAGTPPSPGRPA